MKEKLLAIINTIRDNKGLNLIQEIKETHNLRDDYEFDSFDLAELTVRCEAEYDIDIFESGIVSTVGDILKKSMNKLFWVDQAQEKTYVDLLKDVNDFDKPGNIIFEKQPYRVFVKLIHSMVNDYPVILLDGDLSHDEILANGFDHLNIQDALKIKNKKFTSFEKVLEEIEKTEKWSITLLTSGTTGLPKKVQHNLASISKAVKRSKKHIEDVWAFAYNPTHMAGIQIFYQAIYNQNSMVNVFQMSPIFIQELLNKYHVSHISATPTFYRLFINEDLKFPDVLQITSGGEKLSEKLKNKLETMFPNAGIRNIYASTEAGSLFASEGEIFSIPERFEGKIKIENNEIIIHHSVLGKSESITLTDGWYYTGDIVKIIASSPKIMFSFLSRKNQMINVGGYKVNPEEVEDSLMNIPKIIAARVYGKKNPVLGNILIADVVAESITEKEIRQELNLQSFKIPRIINFVENLNVTRTGKVKR